MFKPVTMFASRGTEWTAAASFLRKHADTRCFRPIVSVDHRNQDGIRPSSRYQDVSRKASLACPRPDSSLQCPANGMHRGALNANPSQSDATPITLHTHHRRYMEAGRLRRGPSTE